MACACNTKRDGSPKTWVVTAPGFTRTYTSELEAKAAAIRRNGSYSPR